MAFNKLSRRMAVAGGIVMLAGVSAMAQPANITGNYRAEGRNPNGTAYVGSAKISENKGNILINWVVGEQRYTGKGVRKGRVVTVEWGAPSPVVYVVMDNGDLHGTWDNGQALERLLRTK